MRFLQSVKDFPLTVDLDGEAPAWGLFRWNGNLRNGGGLRFIPPDDEGFTLRGDKRRLVYRGRKCSHRFTILGDTAFEYDCILNREPESNVITLSMEGADGFDFFRQPDFLKDPFLAGSYTVYKKETLVGEGTGKLCHIHRPEIIDSRGRRCWGDLSVVGNTLCITISEAWLSEAKYPVIVDPTIGTTTVGSQTTWEQDPGDWVPLSNEVCIPVNRFLVSETINGLCTAYFYVYSNEEPESAGYPVLYSDNNNTPLTRRSAQETYIDLQVKSGKPAGWRSGTMRSNGSIPGGSYIWFGLSTEYFWYARFDYGSKYYADDNSANPFPDTYPLYNANFYYNFKPSMYFTYTSAQNYIRTLTQGVTFTDTRKPTGTYKRAMSMNADGITLLAHASDYYRKHINALNISDTASRFRGFVRSVAEHVTAGDLILHCRDFLRTIGNPVLPLTEGKRSLSARRDIADHAETGDSTARQRGFIRTLLAGVTTTDYAGKVFALLRTVREEAAAFGKMGYFGDYLRGIYTEAGSVAETNHAGDYHRIVEDTAHNEGVSLRHLFIFLRLITLSLVRDYIIGRFLRSKEELVIKSPVCREIILDSTLH
jgi:hypothetical protein